MKIIVLRVSIESEKSKRKVLMAAAGVTGVDSVAVDMKDKKITVIGDVDAVYLTSKLRKCGFTELVSVGPAKEEKKEGEKKDVKKEEKKEGDKKDPKKEGKNDGEKKDAKKEGENKVVKKEEKIPEIPTVVHFASNYNHMPYEYSVMSEEDPNACTIC